MTLIPDSAREGDYVHRWTELLQDLRAKGKAACDRGDVVAWSHYAGLHKFLRVSFKGIDPEKDDVLFLETCQTLDMRSRTEPWTLTSPVKAGMIWAAGSCAREVLGVDEEPELLWLRHRARKDGLLESSADEHEADERQARMNFDGDEVGSEDGERAGDEPPDNDDSFNPEDEDEAAAAANGSTPKPARSYKGRGYNPPRDPDEPARKGRRSRPQPVN